MIDLTSVQIALRTRALTLSVCTTGSTTLGQSTQGYTRTTGSFLSDAFYPGMEVTPSGFPTTTRKVVTDVTATLMKVAGGLSTVADASGRTLSVGFPELRAFENREMTTDRAGRPFVEEELVPATNRLLSYPAQGGTLEETGLYVLRWYGLQKYDVPAIRKSVDALKALFAPGTTLTAGSHQLRMRSDIGAFAGQLLNTGDGWCVCTLTIPWQAYSQNTVAA